METWFERFEYSVNPFSVKPSLASFVNLKDMTLQLVQALAAENMIALSGDVGSGKTTILMFLNQNITAPLKPVYHNCVDDKAFDLDRVLEKRESIFDWLFRRKYSAKDNVLLFLDECQFLTERDLEQIKAHFDKRMLKSVVLCSSSLDFLNESMKDRVSLSLAVRQLTKDEVAELISKRVGSGVNPFTRESMYLLAEASGYNPRKVLKNCERVLAELHKRNETPAYILPEHVAEILGVTYAPPGSVPMIERKRTIEEVTKMPANQFIPPYLTAPVDNIEIIQTARPTARPVAKEIVPPAVTELAQPVAQVEPALTEVQSINNVGASFDQPTKTIVAKEEFRWPAELEKLSPLQKEILFAVRDGGKSYEQLCAELNKGRDTIAKQVSRLCLLSDQELMKSRGFEQPVLYKNRETGQILIELAPIARQYMEVKA